MAILWGVSPPVKRCKGSIRMLCIKSGQTFDLVVLGPCVGLQTHWVTNRTVPCLGSQACPNHDQPLTWKGYVPVLVSNWSPEGKQQGNHLWVLVVTEEIGTEAMTWCRGQAMTVSRPGKKSNSPLVSRSRSLAAALDLPESFDVKPYVLRASGFDEGCLIQRAFR